MEELAKLEEERGNQGYLPEDRVVRSDSKKRAAGHGRGSIADGLGGAGEKKGKRERVASNEMCTFLILNISSLQLIPVNMIAYRQREPGGDYWAGNCGDVCEYGGGGNVL